ncbi:MAG: MMPL family transporter [Clostridia bacterium]|nr:MMPL family transporter [Clostridia bacterium]
MEKLSRFVINKPKLVLIISLILLIPAIIGYIFTDVSYEILTYLPDNLYSVKGEQILTDTYNYSSMTMVIVEGKTPKQVQRLKEKIASVENVSSVIWTDDLIDTSVPADILPDELRNIFYSEDGNYTMMMVQFDNDASSLDQSNAVEEIKKVTQKECMLSGLTPINADTKTLTDKQTPLYIAIAVVLAVITLFVAFESYILPILLIAVLGMAVIYNMGTNFIFGDVSFITQCIAAILQLAVTMDYSIIVYNRFKDEKKKTDNISLAMERTLKASVISISGSSLTTLFGFLALCFMQFKIGFNIGIVMAKGVLFGVLTSVTVLPTVLLLADKYIERYKHKNFVPNFSKITKFVVKKRKIFASVAVILLIPAVLLASSVDKYYNLSSTLPEDMDSVQALNVLKEQFNMTTSHFVIVDDDISPKKLAKMESEIQNVDGVNSILAYNVFVGSSVPDIIMPDEINSAVKKGGYQLMLVNSIYEAATDESNNQVEQIDSIIKKYDSNGYITGEGALYNDMIDVTKTDFTVTNIISIAAIFILLLILFKSVSIPIIIILTIELAIWINEGISTIIGTSIPFIAPTLITCVQLGATIDYAILLTSKFKEEIELGRGKIKAIKRAANSAMHSVLQSAAVFFFATFGVYCLCSISMIKTICAMLARGALISAFVIMFVLTPALAILEPVIAKTTKGWGAKQEYKRKRKTPKTVAAGNNGTDNDALIFDEKSYTGFVINDEGDANENN